MSPAQARLESIVDALRKKQLLAVAITALVEALFIAACVYALMRLGLPNVVLSKPRRIVLAIGILLIFVAALFFEHARQSRSSLYLAKRIDLANQLDDHLVSALSFIGPQMGGYEVACIDSLVMRLQSVRVHIPDVRLERVWLLIPAILVAGATGAVDYRRRLHPHDDGGLTIELPGTLRTRMDNMQKVADAAAGKVDPALVKQAADTRAALDKIIEKSASKESVLRDLSEARGALAKQEAEGSRIVDAAVQLGDPSSQRANQMLAALRSGQPGAVSEALRTLSDALSGKKPPPLTAEERQEIASILEAVAQATHAAQLGDELGKIATEMREPANGADAARKVEAAAPALAEALTREAATKQLTSAIRNALAEVGRQTTIATNKAQGTSTGPPPDGGNGISKNFGPGLRTSSLEDEGGDTQITEGGSATGGTGAGNAAEPDYKGGARESAMSADDRRITAPWVNAPTKVMVAAGSTGDENAQKAGRVLLAVEQQVLEREVRREEIPPEYAQPIRRYFSNIQQDWEKKWKPNK